MEPIAAPQDIENLLPAGFYIVGRDCRVLFVSRGMQNFTGHDFTGSICYQVFTEDGSPCENCPARDGLAPGERRELVREGLAEGRCMRIRATGTVFDGRRATIEAWFDETGTQEYRTALARTQRHYRSLVDISPDAVTISDMRGSITHVSRRTCELHGCDGPNDLVGRSAFELIAPEDREKASTFMARTLGKGRVDNVEYRLLRRDGSCFDGQLSAAVIRGIDGEPEAFIAVVRDVTERKRDSAKLLESEQLFRSLADNSPNMVFINQAGRIVYVNEECARTMGYSREEFCSPSFNFMSLIAPESRAMVAENFSKHLAGQEVAPCEYAVQTKDGRKLWAIYSTKLIDYLGQRAILGVITDTTAQRRAEEEKREAQVQLFESQKMSAVGNLTTGISHDFNNLLTAIIGFCDLALRAGNDGQSVTEDMEQARFAAIRAADLTHQLLLFSRKQPFEPSGLDVNSTILAMKAMLSRILGERYKVTTELTPGLPLVSADRVRIEQVVMNLVLNARDAMPEGGTVTIGSGCGSPRTASVSTEPGGGWAFVAVKDEGHGMDQETRSRAFEPFFTTKQLSGGTGLGLSVVHGIVGQHGGHIEVESSPGEGTTITIWLPGAEAAPIPQTEVPSTQVARETGTILLVEDNVFARGFAQTALAAAGHTVLVATDAHGARETFARLDSQIDLVLCDLSLPGGDGLSLCEELNRAKPGLSVLIVTGVAGAEEQVSLANKAGYPVLAKPYGLDALLTTVDRMIASTAPAD